MLAVSNLESQTTSIEVDDRKREEERGDQQRRKSACTRRHGYYFVTVYDVSQRRKELKIRREKREL